LVFHWSDFSHEHIFITFINILFRLDGELLFFACPKKSNQKKRHPDQFALRVPEAFAFAYGPS